MGPTRHESWTSTSMPSGTLSRMPARPTTEALNYCDSPTTTACQSPVSSHCPACRSRTSTGSWLTANEGPLLLSLMGLLGVLVVAVSLINAA